MNTNLLRITLLTMLFSLLAYGQPGPRKSLHNDLKLTDAQQEQFEKINFDMQKKQIDLRAKLQTARLELNRLFDADQLDKNAAEKKMNEIASLQVALRMNHLSAWSEKNKALNADQQKIWKKTLKRHAAMVRHGRNDRMMRMGPQHGDMPGMKIRQRIMIEEEDGPEPGERRIEKKIIKE